MTSHGSEWKTEEHDVIVIGAGISGLTAAHTLSTGANAQDVLVLEARDRIGGRNWSFETGWLDGNNERIQIDLGGSWIHGCEGNPLMPLVEKTKAKLVYTPVDGAAQLRYDGHAISEEEKKGMEEGYEAMHAELEKERNTKKDDLLADIMNKVLARFPANSAQQAGVYWAVAEEENDQAMDAWNMSTSYTYHNQYGDDWAVFPKGYSSILAALEPGKLNIKLNSPVVRIDYDKAAKSVKVFTGHDGKAYACKRVVVTVPLGVLKECEISFIPPLPKAKRDALYQIGQGDFNKLWMLFDKPFWDTDAIWVTRVPIGDDTDSCEYLWESPAYGNRNMVQFINMVGVVGRPVLLAINNGRYAATLDRMGVEKAVDEAVSALRTAFGPDVPRPLDAKMSSWSTDPWARGAYGYVFPGSTPLDAAVYAKPVDDLVFFAGDGTTDLNAYYMHGAYETGLRAAAQVRQSLGFKQPKELLQLGLSSRKPKLARKIPDIIVPENGH